VRRDDFELIEGTLLRLLVEPPAAKLRCVAKTCPLHMVISDLDHQLRTKRFPSEILALAPAAQTARTALIALVVQGPIFPRMTVDIGRAVGPQIFHQLAAPRAREVRADAHVLEVGLAVIEPEKQRSDCRGFIAPVPTTSWVVAVVFTPYLGVTLLPEIKKLDHAYQHIYSTPRYESFPSARRLVGPAQIRGGGSGHRRTELRDEVLMAKVACRLVGSKSCRDHSEIGSTSRLDSSDLSRQNPNRHHWLVEQLVEAHPGGAVRRQSH
jgi:hypothetical protein